MNILITGCAGFIGFHLVKKLCNRKNTKVIGIDNINSYYDVKLKKSRLNIIEKIHNFNFYKIDINNLSKLEKIIKNHKIDQIIHLAAQAGVRYSILNPKTYLDNNVNSFFNILECAKNYKIKKLIYASSSSVYGSRKKFPLFEDDKTDEPQSFYAATKKCNEIMAYSYSAIYNLNCIGLRFFTVYGPYGRPDMSLYKFVDSIYKNKKIDLYNYGNHYRDFTYVDDVIDSIEKIILIKQKSKIPYNIINIGSNNPLSLKKYLSMIEKIIGKKAKVRKLPFQKGDSIKTHASNRKLFKKISYKPNTNLLTGLEQFINWYKKYNNL